MEVGNGYVNRLETIDNNNNNNNRFSRILYVLRSIWESWQQNTDIQLLQLQKQLKYDYDEAHEMVGDIQVPVSRGVGPNFPS